MAQRAGAAALTREANRKRQEVVARAAELFDREGYHSTTMEDIAAAVRIAKPTLYHYFKSKDEILYGIHEEFIGLLIARHRDRVRVGALTGEELLREVMADILELMETHRGHVRVCFEHYRELPRRHQTIIRRKRDRYFAMVEDLIRAEAAAGRLRGDPKLSAFALFGMCNWAYQWYQAQGELSTREIAAAFADILLHGIGVRAT